MSSLPLQRFRRIIYDLQKHPAIRSEVLAAIRHDNDAIMAPQFSLTPDMVWAVGRVLRAHFGVYWCLQFPVLWSADVQTHLESAMRFAPTLDHCLAVVERYGHRRWVFARWHMERGADAVRLTAERSDAVPDVDWRNFVLTSLLNFQTVARASFPDVADKIRFNLADRQPEGVHPPLLGEVRWQADVWAMDIPLAYLGTPSVLADAHVHATLVAALDGSFAASAAPYTAEVVRLMETQSAVQLPIERIAEQMALSVRTLERRLAAENINYRSLQAEVLKGRLQLLLQDGSLSLADIAEKLGYSDETALSRAARRWYGTTLSRLRREFVRPLAR